MGKRSSGKRVVIFGLDGATWDLLEKFTADGTMPNLRGLCSISRWGSMTSTVPPVTAPAWASMATGMNPGNTGIFDFESPSDSIDKFRPITSASFGQFTFPEILEREGRSVVLVNFPTLSFPPRIRGPVLGDVISPPDHLVFPESLRDKSPFKDYRSFPNTNLIGHLDEYVDDIRNLEAVRFECARALFADSWDLFFVMFSATDWIQHQAYADLLLGKESCKKAKLIYSDLDRYLGWFNSSIDEEDSLLIVSDHGFQPSSGTLSINRWLANHGYFTQKLSSRQLSLKMGSSQLYLPGWLLNLISRSPTFWSVSARVAKLFARNSFAFEGKVAPDPEKTLAYSRDYTWGIYLNSRSRYPDGIVSLEEEGETIQKMMSELDQLVESKLIAAARLGRDVYGDRFAKTAPDIVLFPSELVFSGISSDLVRKFPHSGHSMEGIYLLRSGRTKPGRSEGIKIIDVHPTVLSLFDIPVQVDVDGRSMVGETKPRTPGEAHIQAKPGGLTKSDEALIEGRLKDLGYV